MLILAVLFSCSSSDNDTLEPQEEPITLELVAVNNIVGIDEVATFQVKTNKPFGSITHSTDNFTNATTISKNAGDSFGTSLTLYVNTANIGVITYSIRVRDAVDDQITTTNTISFTVEKGNALHIKEVLVNNFYDKDATWDPEFSDTDPNRLADVFFALSKPHIDIFTGQLTKRLWYTSDIKENQGDLLWNLSQENLYINPNGFLILGLADDDGNFVQDLLLGPPTEREISLSQYSTTQPTRITLEDTSINLDLDFGLVW